MAKSVTDQGGDNVVPIKRGRGRPKKNAPSHTTAPDASAKPQGETAPAFGHNRADESLFLRHVQSIRMQQAELEKAKGLVKTERGKLKDIRTLAKSDGIVMRELDEALEALETEHVDLLAREQRRRLYFQWLGLPLEEQAKAFNRDEAGFWFQQGSVAGRLGQERKVPEGVPPDRIQDWLKGWEDGQEALMRELPLTRDGFKKPGEAKGKAASAADGKPPSPAEAAAAAAGAVLVLKEEHFATDTLLEDASKATLLRDHIEAWEAAERIVVIFAGKRRILKEPGFEDTGEPDCETTDPEPLADPENPIADILPAETAGEIEGSADPADAVETAADPVEGEEAAEVAAEEAEAGKAEDFE